MAGGRLQNCNFLPLDIFLLVCYNKDTEGGKKMDKYYLLYSDGTWDAIHTNATEEAIQKRISQHRFPFPIDLKGDSRREVLILKGITHIEKIKGV